MAFAQYKNSAYSVGLLLHILYDKYGIMESDYWTYGNNIIKHGDSIIGQYTWNSNGTWAMFNFTDRNLHKRVQDAVQKALDEVQTIAP